MVASWGEARLASLGDWNRLLGRLVRPRERVQRLARAIQNWAQNLNHPQPQTQNDQTQNQTYPTNSQPNDWLKPNLTLLVLLFILIATTLAILIDSPLDNKLREKIKKIKLWAKKGREKIEKNILFGLFDTFKTLGDNPEIDGILDFWFHGDAQELYNTKWFVPPSSHAQRKIDDFVRTNFGTLLEKALKGELREWIASPRGCLALILVHDQFSRHAFRGDKEIIKRFDALALQLADTMYQRGWLETLSAPELVFALMPYRHSPTEGRLEQVMQLTCTPAEEAEGASLVLQRFRKHTELRLAHMRSDGDPNDILEKPDAEHRLSQDSVLGEPLAKTICEYLSRYEGSSDATKSLPTSPPSPYSISSWSSQFSDAHSKEGLDSIGAESDVKGQLPSLLVSLSGGVDSMVLAHVLVARRRERGGSRVCAVHIDYANRAESGAEADYLRDWCAKREVPLHVRRVEEVKREVTPRDEYEREARRIRFDAYKEAMSQFGANAVLFGHHIGDLQENVISNVMKGANVLDIGGMAESSINQGVPIWRPMLPHSKTVIYDYAHKYGIPYFKDTTPVWSTRGRLRNELLPLLASLYGEGYSTQLSNLANDSSMCAQLFDRQLFDRFRASISKSSVAVSFDAAPWAHLSRFFWREALKYVCEKCLGIGMVQKKAITVLIAHLRRNPPLEGWVTLRKESPVLLSGGRVIFIRPGVFRGKREGKLIKVLLHAEEGHPVMATEAAKIGAHITLGGWRIRFLFSDTDQPTANCLQLDDVLSGQFSYQLQANESYSVASATRIHVPALRNVLSRYERFMAAVPQIVASGNAIPGRSLIAEYEYVGLGLEAKNFSL